MWLAWTASQRSEARAIEEGRDEPRKTGACVLERKTHRVLALGYNGFLPGFKPPEDFYADRVKRVSHIIHAETNALVYVPTGAVQVPQTGVSPAVFKRSTGARRPEARTAKRAHFVRLGPSL